MPEGPLGAPRLTTIGPLSRETSEEIKKEWRDCPSGREGEICKEIKKASLAILENQGAFAEYKTLVGINSGRCHDVARRVSNKLEYTTYLATYGGDHGWIEYNGKHYDAEVPTGVDRVKHLPFFARFPPMTILHFAQRHAKSEGDEEIPQQFHETIVERE